MRKKDEEKSVRKRINIIKTDAITYILEGAGFHIFVLQDCVNYHVQFTSLNISVIA